MTPLLAAAAPVHVASIGEVAHAALSRSHGVARSVAPLTGSVYLDAAGDLLWLGAPGSALHARAVIASGAVPGVTPGTRIELEIDGAVPWRPAATSLAAGAGLAARARAVADRIVTSQPPSGFGALLASQRLAFPLDGAADSARDLAAACRARDADRVERTARVLIGLGPGLTPAGDDYVGGALFAMATTRAFDRDATWRRVVERLLARAATSTHPVSAVLLSDLAAGRGVAPLHELAAALGAEDVARAVDAARRLTRIGHSSGWDMLAGFLGSLGA